MSRSFALAEAGEFQTKSILSTSAFPKRLNGCGKKPEALHLAWSGTCFFARRD
jgi:hypothetical protein